jgi:uncharacterized damage-inducible protein DinB
MSSGSTCPLDPTPFKENNMRIDDIQTLYAYNYWANARILETAARLPAEQFATASLAETNLKETLVHILVTESVWLLRWQELAPELGDFPADFPTLESVHSQWQQEKQRVLTYLATLTDGDLDKKVTYLGADRQSFTRTLWHLLVHVVNHGTQHRSEVAMVLSALGHSPGGLDFTIFLREQGK